MAELRAAVPARRQRGARRPDRPPLIRRQCRRGIGPSAPSAPFRRSQRQPARQTSQMMPVLVHQLHHDNRVHPEMLLRRRPVPLHPPPLRAKRLLGHAQGELLEPRIAHPKPHLAIPFAHRFLAPVPHHRPVMKLRLARRKRVIAGPTSSLPK